MKLPFIQQANISVLMRIGFLWSIITAIMFYFISKIPIYVKCGVFMVIILVDLIILYILGSDEDVNNL